MGSIDALSGEKTEGLDTLLHQKMEEFGVLGAKKYEPRTGEYIYDISKDENRILIHYALKDYDLNHILKNYI